MDEIECPNCGSLDLEPLDLLEDESIVYLVCNNCSNEFEEEI